MARRKKQETAESATVDALGLSIHEVISCATADAESSTMESSPAMELRTMINQFSRLSILNAPARERMRLDALALVDKMEGVDDAKADH